jgi:hypothetical protein
MKGCAFLQAFLHGFMNKKGIWGMGLGAAALLTGCQCTPPVGECTTPVDVSKEMCAPLVACPSTVTTAIRHCDQACPAALPPVGEITVVRSGCQPTKMVFVSVRPSDDRYYNPESRNFERPWPWGPYGMGCQ